MGRTVSVFMLIKEWACVCVGVCVGSVYICSCFVFLKLELCACFVLSGCVGVWCVQSYSN